MSWKYGRGMTGAAGGCVVGKKLLIPLGKASRRGWEEIPRRLSSGGVGTERRAMTTTTTSSTKRTTSTKEKERAVVLLSGGLDSTTILAMAREQFRCLALSFDYGQRHRFELQAAREVAEELGAEEHRTIRMDLRTFGHSALTDDDMEVPKDRDEAIMSTDIPSTYVPARNTIFLSYALAYAEVSQSDHIFIGANAVDYSGYPDCRPEYFKAFQVMANLATKRGVEDDFVDDHGQHAGMTIHTPLLHWSKTRIIEEGLKRGVDFGKTHSCYDPGEKGRPCRRCDSCVLRRTAFQKLGYTDDPAMLRPR